MSERELVGRSTCSALVITCSDFRFKRAEQAFAESAGLRDDYDLIARPGGIRSLVAPRNEAARLSMRDEMLLLWRLHRFGRVLMVNHLSCRAYDDIATAESERQVHATHLAAAGPIVAAMLEGVRAEAYVAGLGEDGALSVSAIDK